MSSNYLQNIKICLPVNSAVDDDDNNKNNNYNSNKAPALVHSWQYSGRNETSEKHVYTLTSQVLLARDFSRVRALKKRAFLGRSFPAAWAAFNYLPASCSSYKEKKRRLLLTAPHYRFRRVGDPATICVRLAGYSPWWTRETNAPTYVVLPTKLGNTWAISGVS